MEKLKDIQYNYVCVYHNLMCLLHVVGILLDHYEQEEGHRETEMVLHIIKKNLEADKKDLRDNNNEFDEYLMDKVDIVDDEEDE